MTKALVAAHAAILHALASAPWVHRSYKRVTHAKPMDAKGRVAQLVRQERALAVGCDEARLLGSQEVPLQLGDTVTSYSSTARAVS